MTAAQTLDSSGVKPPASTRLVRTLSFTDMVLYALVFMCFIAPMGIFGSVFQASGGMVALVYAVGALAMMINASSYGVCANAYQAAGSVYTYAGRAIAPWVGWIAGWMMGLDYFLVPGLLSLIAAASMTAVFPALAVWIWIVVFTLLNTGINLLGIKTTRLVNKFFLAGQALVVIIYAAAAVMALATGAGRGFSWEPVYNSGTFQIGVLASGVSLGVLSYLGFDALSTMSEDAKGGARQVGRAQIAALGLAGLAFMLQSFLAALLVKDPATLIAEGDPAGTAFYDTARVAAGPWLATTTAISVALAWGVANNMVAQVATSRLLYAMGKDGALPRFLAKVSVGRSVPVNAILLTAAVSLGLGLWMASRDDGIALLSSLVTFGALFSFVLVHLSVLVRNVRRGERPVAGWFRSWALPVVGIGVTVFVIANANVLAQKVGYAWLAAGVVILIAMVASGKKLRLPGIDVSPAVEDAAVVGHRG